MADPVKSAGSPGDKKQNALESLVLVAIAFLTIFKEYKFRYATEAVLGLALVGALVKGGPVLYRVVHRRVAHEEEPQEFSSKLSDWREQAKPTLSETLREFHDVLSKDGVESEEKLRVTVFVARDSDLTLHQIARYSWNKSRNPSSTVIRMGTGVVGIAYTREEVLAHEVGEDFVASVKKVGIEELEASAHSQDRKSFWAMPLYRATDRAKRIGVIVVDSARPKVQMRLREKSIALRKFEDKFKAGIVGVLEKMGV